MTEPVLLPLTERSAARGTLAAADQGRREMVDSFGRVVRDLRVSVTDRCNFRCLYCMPEDGLPWLPAQAKLSTTELVRVLKVAVGLGVRTIRVTGGEPTLRRDLVEVVAALAGLGVELSMTTNGFLLDKLAEPLARAGLGRVNVSLDSLDEDRFEAITRRRGLARVLRGIDAAFAAGLEPLKVNTVVVRGFNDDEVVPMAAWARERGIELRFIEFMPLDAPGDWTADQVVPAAEILDRLDAAFGLAEREPRGSAPAERYRYADGTGTVGIIASVTRAFCAQCDRIRVTADGQVRTCLFATTEHDLRAVLRAGGDDEALAQVYLGAVARKQWGHRIGQDDFVQPERGMSQIGG